MEANMDMDDDEAMDGPKIIHPYEEVDPLNLPPPGSDSEPKDVIVPTSRSTLQLLPHIRRFSCKFYVREGSSFDASVANHRKVFAPGPLGKDVNALHYKLKEDDVQKENNRLKMMLGSAEDCIRPYDATAIPVAQVIADDLYIPAATNDPAAQGNAEGPASGTGGPAGAPAVRECSFAWKKVKFAAATLQGQTLTWWNSQVATLGLENANRTMWTELKRLMMEESCLAEEI
ncbi:hypothetical protein Tco_0180502 [Tanacetum coccineum]